MSPHKVLDNEKKMLYELTQLSVPQGALELSKTAGGFALISCADGVNKDL